MSNVCGNIITLMRGDTLNIPILLNIGSKLNPQYYELKPADRLYFALMEPNQAFEDAILKKKYDAFSLQDNDGNVLLNLKSSDTEKLLVGKYYYTIRLRTVDMYNEEVVRTIVPPTLFWLMGEDVAVEEETYYEKEHYEIDRVILDGGEII